MMFTHIVQNIAGAAGERRSWSREGTVALILRKAGGLFQNLSVLVATSPPVMPFASVARVMM